MKDLTIALSSRLGALAETRDGSVPEAQAIPRGSRAGLAGLLSLFSLSPQLPVCYRG